MRWKKCLHGISASVAIATGTMLIGCGTGTVPGASLISTGSSLPTGTGSSSSTTNPPSTGTTTSPSTGTGTSSSSGTSGSGTSATAPPVTTPANPPASSTTGSTTTPPVTTPPSTTPSTPAATLSGTVFSGQNLPVRGAKMTLYAVGTSGYGAGARSLLGGSGSVLTDDRGRFTGSYVCSSATARVYLIAAGGNAGAGANQGAVMMSALGACGTINAQTIVVNEITTVASVYALEQFMQPGSVEIGGSSSNAIGLANGFKTAANLYDGTTGRLRAKTPAGNGTIPQTKLDSLANLVANCIESATGSVACTRLYQATAIAGVTPQNTLTAMLNIALHPAINLKSLTLTGPYQPWLAGAPNDWTLSIEYTGGGLNYGQLIASDAEGNIWVPNATDPGTLSKFGPAGEPLSGAAGFGGGGLSYPQAVAIDQGGNVWAANQGNDSVSEHRSNGTAKSGAGFKVSGLKLPYALAIDGSGGIFTVNGDNSVTKLNSSGGFAGHFQQGGLDFPFALAIDRSPNVWVANYGFSNRVSRLSNAGTPVIANGYSGGGINGAVGVAIDASGNAWIASFDRPVVSKFSTSGSPLSGSGYVLPAGAASIAVDGDNTIWTANSDGSISRFANQGTAISPATGYVSNGATAGVGIAIDPSGNVWTSDNYVNSLFEYIGAAAPTTVPLQVAIQKNLMGKRP